MRIGKGAIERKSGLERKIIGFLFLVGISAFWLIFLTPLLGSIIFLTGIKHNLNNLKISNADLTDSDIVKLSVSYLPGLPYFSITAKNIMIGLGTSRNENPMGYLYSEEIMIVNNPMNKIDISMRYVIPEKMCEINERFLLKVENHMLFTFKGTIFLKLKNNLPGISIPVVFPYTLGWCIGKNSMSIGINKSAQKLVDTLPKSSEEVNGSKESDINMKPSKRSTLPIELKGYTLTEKNCVTTLKANYRYKNMPSFLSINIPETVMSFYIDKKKVGTIKIDEHKIRNGVILERRNATNMNALLGMKNKSIKKDFDEVETLDAISGKEKKESMSTATFTLTLSPNNISNLRGAIEAYLDKTPISFTFSINNVNRYHSMPYAFHHRIIRQISKVYINRIVPGKKTVLPIVSSPLFEGKIERIKNNGIHCKLIFNEILFPYEGLIESLNTGEIFSTNLNLLVNDEIVIVGTGSHYTALDKTHTPEYYKKFFVVEATLSFPSDFSELSYIFKKANPYISSVVQSCEISIGSCPTSSMDKMFSKFGLRWKVGQGISVGYKWNAPSPSTVEYPKHYTTYRMSLLLCEETNEISMGKFLDQRPFLLFCSPAAGLKSTEVTKNRGQFPFAVYSVECMERKEQENYVRIGWEGFDAVLMKHNIGFTLRANKSYIDVLASPASDEWSIRSSIKTVIQLFVNTYNDGPERTEKFSLIRIANYENDPDGYKLSPIHIALHNPHKRNENVRNAHIIKNIDAIINNVIKNLFTTWEPAVEFLKYKEMEANTGQMYPDDWITEPKISRILFHLKEMPISNKPADSSKESAIVFSLWVPSTGVVLRKDNSIEAEHIISVDPIEVCLIYRTKTNNTIRIGKYHDRGGNTDDSICIKNTFWKSTIPERLTLKVQGINGYFNPFNENLSLLFKIVMCVVLGDDLSDPFPSKENEEQHYKNTLNPNKKLAVEFNVDGSNEEYLFFSSILSYGNKFVNLSPSNLAIESKNGIASVSNVYIKMMHQKDMFIFFKIDFIKMCISKEPFRLHGELSLKIYHAMFNYLMGTRDPNPLKFEMCYIDKDKQEKTILSLPDVHLFRMIASLLIRYLKKKGEPAEKPRMYNNDTLSIAVQKMRSIYVENDNIFTPVKIPRNNSYKTNIPEVLPGYADSFITILRNTKQKYITELVEYDDKYIYKNLNKEKGNGETQPKYKLDTKLHPIPISDKQKQVIQGMCCTNIILPLTIQSSVLDEWYIKKMVQTLSNLFGAKKREIDMSIQIKNFHIANVSNYKKGPDNSAIVVYINEFVWNHNEINSCSTAPSSEKSTVSVVASIILPNTIDIHHDISSYIKMSPIIEFVYTCINNYTQKNIIGFHMPEPEKMGFLEKTVDMIKAFGNSRVVSFFSLSNIKTACWCIWKYINFNFDLFLVLGGEKLNVENDKYTTFLTSYYNKNLFIAKYTKKIKPESELVKNNKEESGQDEVLNTDEAKDRKSTYIVILRNKEPIAYLDIMMMITQEPHVIFFPLYVNKAILAATLKEWRTWKPEEKAELDLKNDLWAYLVINDMMVGSFRMPAYNVAEVSSFYTKAAALASYLPCTSISGLSDLLYTIIVYLIDRKLPSVVKDAQKTDAYNKAVQEMLYSKIKKDIATYPLPSENNKKTPEELAMQQSNKKSI
ncbi:hypothetical protein NEIRO02_1391 [Nematocida sp. AWRm79]|nr:hypothetical protein NEIRO02_1391 [Nematocida sp. AWRm79]